jgi:hypothetical protein
MLLTKYCRLQIPSRSNKANMYHAMSKLIYYNFPHSLLNSVNAKVNNWKFHLWSPNQMVIKFTRYFKNLLIKYNF